MATCRRYSLAAIAFGSDWPVRHSFGVGVGVIWIVVALLSASGCGRMPAPVLAAKTDVEVAPVVEKDVPVFTEWIGTLDGLVHAHVHPQVTGYLMVRDYREGSEVKKGDLMFEIDPRPFQAILNQALARLGKSEMDVKRLTPLVADRAVSKQELDDAEQALLGDKASVEQARFNVEFTKVTSPMDGLSGLATAEVGDLVGPNTTELTTVTTVDPIKAYFSVSELECLQFMSRYAAESVRGETNDENSLELILAGETLYPRRGRFYAADNQMDARTGTLRMAAIFPNPEHTLRPGQFARVRLTRLRRAARIVPQRAVSELQGNFQVIVVDSDDRSHVRPVKMGPVSGQMWIVESGVQVGERVVVEGVQKVREGVQVNPRPYTPSVPVGSKPGA